MSDWVSIALSGGALIVAVLSWLAARRSAAASAESARQATRSADIAEREERARQRERDEAAAPHFDVQNVRVNDHSLEADLVLRGGPGLVDLQIGPPDPDAPEFDAVRGISAAVDKYESSPGLYRHNVGPDRPVHVVVHLHPERLDKGPIAITLTVDVQEQTEPRRTWSQPVTIQRPGRTGKVW